MSRGRTAALLRLGGLLLVTVVAAVALAADWDSPMRAVVVFSFMLFVPGLAIAELLTVRDPVQQLAMAAAVSLAAETLVALALLYAGLYSARLAFAIIAALTVVGLAIATLRAWRSAVPVVDPAHCGASP